MRVMKRAAAVINAALAACVLAAAVRIPVMAEENGNTVIDRLSLNVVSEIKVGNECTARDIEIEIQNEGYEVRDIELVNKNQVWGNADVPRILVYFRAEDGYTFAIDRTKNRILGAELEYARWDDFLCRYIVQLRLPSLQEQVGEITEARWDSLTCAGWSPSYNAARYEVQLYRDGKRIGPVISADTNSCDLGLHMRAAGTYTYRVRAVNRRRETVKSEWAESGASVIDSSNVEWVQQQYPVIPGSGPGQAVSAAAPYYQDMYGWIPEGNLWWFRNPDGTYTTNNWQYIDEKWYYFDSKGYMVTGWIDWNDKSYYCDPESGAMLVSMIVPDGLGRRVDSTGAWVQ